jgi:hypothetical protein
MAGTALLVKVGLDTATAGSVVTSGLDTIGGFISLLAGFYLSAQNASPSITNPVIVKPAAFADLSADAWETNKPVQSAPPKPTTAAGKPITIEGSSDIVAPPV